MNGLIYKRNKAVQSTSNKHKDLEKTVYLEFNSPLTQKTN